MSSAAIAGEVGLCWEAAGCAEEAEHSSIREEISRAHFEIATTDPV
jgi:hypothetical protein